MDAGELAEHRSEHDDRKRYQECVGKPGLAPRLAARDERQEEDPGGQERGGDEEDGQLDVPRPREVERQDLGEVDAEEVAEFRPVVL